MARRGVTRHAFTLIECAAALVVFAAVVLLWAPLIRLATTPPNDGEILAVLSAVRHIETQAAGGDVTAAGSQIRIKSPNGKQYVVAFYSSAASGSILRMTTTAGGHMPLLSKVRAFDVIKLGPETVRYTITLLDNLTFTGVLASHQKQASKTK